MGSPAVFLDRDGTINEEVGYLSDPEQAKVAIDSVAAVLAITTNTFIVFSSNAPNPGNFDGAGDFSVTNAMNTNETQRFYLLRQP